MKITISEIQKHIFAIFPVDYRQSVDGKCYRDRSPLNEMLKCVQKKYKKINENSLYRNYQNSLSNVIVYNKNSYGKMWCDIIFPFMVCRNEYTPEPQR